MLEDGSVRQSIHSINPGDYGDERIHYPVLGIVLDIFYSDSSVNRTSNNGNKRGTQCEARVLVIDDGTDTPWFLPRVTVLPRSSSGVDNYQEEFPKPCTKMIDGTVFDGSLNVDVKKLDGDYVIIQFLGGNIRKPMITNWYPHPGNTSDPATSGAIEGLLDQENRLFKRYQGVEFTITGDGSIYLNTNNSGSIQTADQKGLKRLNSLNGGDIQLDVKNNRKLEINFNSPVPYTNVPSVPQLNPQTSVFDRPSVLSKFKIDKDFIELLAGKISKIVGNSTVDSVWLGVAPTDHVPLGETLLIALNEWVSRYNGLVDFVDHHIHIDGEGLVTSGPTGEPTPPDASGDSPSFTPAYRAWLLSASTIGLAQTIITLGNAPSQTFPKYSPDPVASGATADPIPQSVLSKIVKLQ